MKFDDFLTSSSSLETCTWKGHQTLAFYPCLTFGYLVIGSKDVVSEIFFWLNYMARIDLDKLSDVTYSASVIG